jgi:hypothetical protein
MRKCDLNCIGFLFLTLSIAGCEHSAQTVKYGGKSDGDHSTLSPSKIRNQLLIRLQDQDLDGKLHTLMEIIERGEEQAMRRDALHYLAGQADIAKSLVPSLVKLLLIERDPAIVNDLQNLLVEIEVPVDSLLLTNTDGLDEDQVLRVVETLGLMRASSPQVLEFLRLQMLENNPKRILAVCRALEGIGAPGQSFLPKLIAIAKRTRLPMDDNDQGRAYRESRDRTHAAVRAIAAVGADPSAIGVLIDCLAMEPQIASTAADALAKLGPAACVALPALQALSARNDHGGHDVKTRTAKDAAKNAILAIQAQL